MFGLDLERTDRSWGKIEDAKHQPISSESVTLFRDPRTGDLVPFGALDMTLEQWRAALDAREETGR